MKIVKHGKFLKLLLLIPTIYLSHTAIYYSFVKHWRLLSARNLCVICVAKNNLCTYKPWTRHQIMDVSTTESTQSNWHQSRNLVEVVYWLEYESKSKINNDVEIDVFKLMNNPVLKKTMGNLRNHRDIRLVTTERRRSCLVYEPQYQITKWFAENLLALEMKKQKIIIKQK